MVRIALFTLAAILVALLAAWFVANARYRARMAETEAAWSSIAASAAPATLRFDPAALDGQPEIARRYLRHAIAPGTPLVTTVRLDMHGEFRLGDATDPRPMRMQARQILAAPGAFVWIARMRGGGMRISGSDGLYDGHGWTRFWAFAALPLVQAASSEALDRSALARPALESVWAPAALHPALGARWHQSGPNSAEVTLGTGGREVVVALTFSADGAVRSLVARRWSNENPDRTYRWQPFGGDVSGEATYGGFTIPARITVGNHYGTPGYFPFFEVRITAADYLPAQP